MQEIRIIYWIELSDYKIWLRTDRNPVKRYTIIYNLFAQDMHILITFAFA